MGGMSFVGRAFQVSRAAPACHAPVIPEAEPRARDGGCYQHRRHFVTTPRGIAKWVDRFKAKGLRFETDRVVNSAGNDTGGSMAVTHSEACVGASIVYAELPRED
jgi:hypothetical protein